MALPRGEAKGAADRRPTTPPDQGLVPRNPRGRRSLRETFEASRRAQRRPRQRERRDGVFKDAAGMRAAEAAYDVPWRVAPAKPAAVGDQPPPPPPKTGEV